MSIILFIIILVVLIVGHEFGHLIVAKASGMKVPEFGIGFPPRLWGKKFGETEYTVNAIPFGGFVKIEGEDIAEGEKAGGDPTSFSNRPKYAQAATLFAGPFMNILIALVLSSSAFMLGVPAAIEGGFDPVYISDVGVAVVEVIPDSPAAKAGIEAGDRIVSLETESGRSIDPLTPEAVSTAIATSEGPVTLSLLRSGNPVSLTLSPEKGLVPEEPDRQAIGIASAAVGTLKLPLFEAIKAGFRQTLQDTWSVLTGITLLIGQAFTFSADLSGVAGPVGIANLVGSAATFGLGSILSFAALISVNLGVINLFPFPALDGGRLALLFVEAVSGRRVPAKVANGLNAVGFALLIALMVAVTIHDVSRLVS